MIVQGIAIAMNPPHPLGAVSPEAPLNLGGKLVEYLFPAVRLPGQTIFRVSVEMELDDADLVEQLLADALGIKDHGLYVAWTHHDNGQKLDRHLHDPLLRRVVPMWSHLNGLHLFSDVDHISRGNLSQLANDLRASSVFQSMNGEELRHHVGGATMPSVANHPQVYRVRGSSLVDMHDTSFAGGDLFQSYELAEGSSKKLPSAVSSQVVPTEYDVWVEGRLVVLSDDRSRRFSSDTLPEAVEKAELTQDSQDPIHSEPFPDPATVPWPPVE